MTLFIKYQVFEFYYQVLNRIPKIYADHRKDGMYLAK